MPEPEKYLPMNRAELIARCEALEAALRTIAAYRGKNDVAHQLAYIAEAALDSETQPTGNYTDSIDVAESFAAETKVCTCAEVARGHDDDCPTWKIKGD